MTSLLHTLQLCGNKVFATFKNSSVKLVLSDRKSNYFVIANSVFPTLGLLSAWKPCPAPLTLWSGLLIGTIVEIILQQNRVLDLLWLSLVLEFVINRNIGSLLLTDYIRMITGSVLSFFKIKPFMLRVWSIHQHSTLSFLWNLLIFFASMDHLVFRVVSE